MSIQYKMVAMNDNLNAADDRKTGYYPKVVRRNTVGIAELAKTASCHCNFKEFELKLAAEVLLQALREELENSNHVCLEGFGTFSVAAESRYVESPNELRAESIQVKKVSFKCSPLLIKKMKSASFVKYKQP